MSLLFALRGDSLIPRFTMGYKTTIPWVAPANFATLAAPFAIAHPSVFGGSAIDFRFVNGDTRQQFYSALKNWPMGRTGAVIVRIVPDWTGAPTQKQVYLQVGDSGGGPFASGGLTLIEEPGYPLNIRAAYAHDQAGHLFNVHVDPGAYTAGVATEFCVSWDNNTGVVSVSRDGVEIATGSLVTPANPTYAERYVLDDLRAGTIRLGGYPSDHLINELLIFDTAINHEYSPRTGFYSCISYEGANPDVPDDEDVRAGVGTGTLVVPDEAEVKHDVVYDGGREGTYRGHDLFDTIDPENVADTLTYLADGNTLQGLLSADSVDPGQDKVFNGHPYKINGIQKVGSYSPFAIEPGAAESKITLGFAALADLMATLFPAADGWNRLPNPYKPEENPDIFLKMGWGLALGPANPEQLQVGCVYDFNRGITIVLSRKFEGLENDASLKAGTEIQILEDQRRLINYLEQNASLNGTIMYTQYQNDGGLEYVRSETDKFLMCRTTVSFQYIENFV